MSESSEILKSLFQKYCEENGKLFLSRPDDAGIADAMLSFYRRYHSIEVLEQAVEYYVKTSSDPILVYNFAVESSKIREHILEENKIKQDFSELIRETKERMERFK